MTDMKKRFETIVEKITALSTADDFIIQWHADDSALTRIATNMVTQNVDTISESLSLTSYFDSKKASLSSANLTDEGIKRLVEKCEIAAKNSIADKEYLPSLPADNQAIENHIDDAVVNLGPNERANIAKYAIERSKKENVIMAGIVKKGIFHYGMATKNGLSKFYSKTQVEYKNTIDINDRHGAAWENGYQLSAIDVEKIYNEAFNDARLLNQQIEFEPGKYKVLLGSRATKDIFSMMGYYGMDRRATDEGYSPYSGKIGQKIADERISIFTDPASGLAPSAPFDYEGLPINKKHIIKDGVLEDIPCSRFWAKKNDYNPWSIGNVIFSEGDKSEDKLLASIDRGFYIKEFWYIRLVRMNDLTLTGMTRNGLFYVEDGLLVSGSSHFRWNDSPISMLNRIIDIGKGRGAMPEWGRPIYAPPMIINDFNLSSKTLF